MILYSSLSNQLNNILHFLFSYLLVFYLLPRYIFKRKDECSYERIVANFIKMVFLIIVLGYLFVILKLFEMISLIVVFIILIYRRYIIDHSLKNFGEIFSDLYVTLYDYLDGIIHPRESFKNWRANRIGNRRKALKSYFSTIYRPILTLLMLLITAYSAYIRFYDPVVNAAPAMSDAYTTLAWMKYIEARVLFHDGIYPQGFHIVLAVIHKFSFIDQLYILKYTGPLNGVLTTLGIAFATWKMTGKKIPGAIAAIVYGILGSYLPMEWERQASTNSQEFAFVFVLPTIYFFIRYMRLKRKADLLTAASGICVIGLVHSFPFALAGLGMVILIGTALISNIKKYWKPSWMISVVGMISVLVALLPYLVGIIAGIKAHSSTEDYLYSKATETTFPKLYIVDKVSLVFIGIIFIYLLFNRKKNVNSLVQSYVLFFSLSVFIMYHFLGTLIESQLLLSRSGTLWALIIPLCIGMGWSVVTDIVPFINKYRFIELTSSFIILAAILYYLSPKVIIPYKMEWNSGIEQYLRIIKMYRPQTWTFVSEQEGYSLALANGYHEYVSDLLNDFDPQSLDLYQWRGIARNIFIYYQKNIFEVNKENGVYSISEKFYIKRRAEKVLLGKWIQSYQSTHDNISVFFEDENLIVYYINLPIQKDDAFKDIWDGVSVP